MWLLGIERAYPLLMEGRRYSPQEAIKVGIVDDLANDTDELMRKAKKWLLTDPPTPPPLGRCLPNHPRRQPRPTPI